MDNQTYENRSKKRYRYNGILIVFLLFAVYIFLQMYLVNANSVDIVKAGEGYINDSIITQGMICREETVLTQNSTGVVDYLVNDGERVSKGGLVAKAYPSYSDIEKIIYLRTLESNLDNINTANGYIDGNPLDISQTRKQLTGQLTQLSEIFTTQDYTKSDEKLTDLVLSLNKISVATGKTDSFSGAKSVLKNEISSLESQIRRPLTSLYTPYTGYFIKTVDGLESVATPDKFVSSSYQWGQDMIDNYAGNIEDTVQYGKIITNYKWCICTYVDTNDAQNLTEGKSISISLKINENTFTKAKVKNVVNMGEKTLIVIECTELDEYSASARVTDCEILFKQYTGIKIPKSAIHFVGEEMGVYVSFSNVVYFKKIAPIYEDDNYVIVPKKQDENNQVEMYDSIIVKGRNLYNGKYL